jgi:hypothetical protein
MFLTRYLGCLFFIFPMFRGLLACFGVIYFSLAGADMGWQVPTLLRHKASARQAYLR